MGKGVASARIRYGPGRKDIVEVFTTHVSFHISMAGGVSANESSFTHPTKPNPTIPTSAIELHKPGR